MNKIAFVFKRFLIEETDDMENIVNTEIIEEDQQAQSNQGDRKISDEQAQQIAQGLQSGQISEEEVQQALQNGQMTEADVQAIQNFMNQQAQNPNESQFEQEISKITDSIIRLNMYDRIQKLQQKIENIINLNTKVDSEKFEHIYNYLDILLALVYTLDINILYQLYVALEVKTIEYIKQELGLDTSEEKRLQIALEIEGEKEDLKQKYTPENLIQQFSLYFMDQLSNDDKKQFEKDVEKLIALNIYTPEQIEDFKQQAQQQVQQAQQAASEEPNGPNPEQIEQAAQAIVSGEATEKELDQMLQQGQIDQNTYDAIKQRIQELQQGQTQNQQENQNNQPDPSQIEQAAQAIVSGEASPQELDQMLQQGQIDQATYNQIKQRVQELQQMNQNQPQQPQPDESQIETIAQAVFNGEMSADELIQAFKNGEIDNQTFELIIQKIEELKNQNQQEQVQTQSQEQPNQNQAQSQQSQPTFSEDQILAAAQAIISGEATLQELDQMLQEGQIDQNTYNLIMQKVQELSQNNKYQQIAQNS